MLQVRLFRIYNTLLRFLLITDAIVQSQLCFSECGLLLCDMTTGPCSCSSPCLGPPLPYTQNVQIQSITDESRSSIRRKNQGPGQGSSLSRQSSLMDDTQEDEVAHFLTRPAPRPRGSSPPSSPLARLFKDESLDHPSRLCEPLPGFLLPH